jgi:hypothetical protein
MPIEKAKGPTSASRRANGPTTQSRRGGRPGQRGAEIAAVTLKPGLLQRVFGPQISHNHKHTLSRKNVRCKRNPTKVGKNMNAAVYQRD